MKKSITAFLLLFLFQPHLLKAFAKPFGVGVRIGSPSGISLKYWLNGINAIDGILSWDLDDNKEVAIYGSYLVHQPSDLKIKLSPVDFYYGLGASIESQTRAKTNKSETSLGVRIPVGLSHHWQRQSIELYGELGTQLELIPSTTVSIDTGIGARFFF
ncbi:MAG: hypothetical protein RJB66_2693 [Pseudomonadota bacterium]|jgi:hypothetical protein